MKIEYVGNPRIITLHEIGYQNYGFIDEFDKKYSLSALDLHTPNFIRKDKIVNVSNISIIRIDKITVTTRHRIEKRKHKNKIIKFLQIVCNFFGHIEFEIIDDETFDCSKVTLSNNDTIYVSETIEEIKKLISDSELKV